MLFFIEDFPMRKIKVFSRIYKSLLVLCRKDLFQYMYIFHYYIYNIISTRVASSCVNSGSWSNCGQCYFFFKKNTFYIYDTLEIIIVKLHSKH